MELIVALEAFVRAAERLSFSAAARDLMTSQPHITRAVSQLESRLGAQLFLRSTRRLTLTDEGIEYLAHARAILASIDDADHSVGRRAGKLAGQLRVFAPVSLGWAWIVPRLRDFMLQYPDLNVHLVLDDRPRDLIEERLDVGIRIGPLQDSTLRVRTLGEVGYSIVAAPEFWKQHGKPKTVDALASLPAIIFDGTIRADQFTRPSAG